MKGMSVRGIGFKVSWSLTVAACGVVYVLLMRHGRLLYHVEELESQLNDFTVASAPVIYGYDAAAVLQSSRISRSRVP